ARGFALQREPQIARLAMPPIEHGLVAVDPQPYIVFPAGGRLGDGERAACAAVELEQRRNVIDELAPRDKRTDVGRDARHGEPGYEARQMLGVAADGTHHQREPAAPRIENPAEAAALPPFVP